MAKMNKEATDTQAPIAVPDFYDVDSDAIKAAQSALAGGNTPPLTVPSDAKVSENKGTTYSRWQEDVNITGAYRSVTNSGLMDIAISGKVRQSEDNAGKRVWFHFYMNTKAEDRSEGHEKMNEKTIGALSLLLASTNLMPKSGGLKGTLLNQMFPQKNQPGKVSPLIGKNVLVNILQQKGPRKDKKTGKIEKNDKGEVLIDIRDSAESFMAEDDSE